MGMFDYVRVEPPLPDGWEASLLQTKDFDCELVTHIITAEGRMMLDTAGFWNGEPNYKDANFHGFVSLIGIETVGHEPDDRYGPNGRPIYKSHDYLAKFTDGQLVEITLVPE